MRPEVWFVSLTLMTVSALPASAAQETAAPKLHPDLTKIAVPAHQAKVNVIVQFTRRPGAAMHRKVAGKLGGELYRDLAVIDSAAYRVPGARLAELSQWKEVRRISPDGQVQATMDVTAATTGAATAYSSYGLTGKGIGVAVIDTGVEWNADFNDNSGNQRVVYKGHFRTDATTDDLAGHGTHVAAIIAGNGKNSTGSSYTRTFRGIAPGARIISLAALDRFSKGKDSDVIAAIQKAIDLKNTYNIRVLNLSLGRPVSQSYATDPLCQAVEKAWKAGIVVVAAAGNEGRNNTRSTSGYGTISAPGNDPLVITVGAAKTRGTASRSDDAVASYSSKGPTLLDRVVKPDLVAPGNQMVSALALGGRMRNAYAGNGVLLQYYIKNVTATNQRSDQYYWMSGTSMATPVVSGAVALMLEKDPSLTPDQVKARLMKTAWKSFPVQATATDPATGATYVTRHDIFTIGAGYLDITAALNNCDRATASARSPRVVYDSAAKKVKLDFGSSGSNVIWGDNVTWGTNVIWGDNVVWGENVVWGDNVIWGDNTMSGFNVIWGTNVVWGTSNPIAAESDPVAIQGEK